MNNFDVLVKKYGSLSKWPKRILSAVIFTAMLLGFSWSQEVWMYGGSFVTAILIQLPTAGLVLFYGLICWEAEKKEKNPGRN